MTKLTNRLGQVLTAAPGSQVVAFIPKGAKVMCHGGLVWFFHPKHPARECTYEEVVQQQPNTIEDWLKITREVVL